MLKFHIIMGVTIHTKRMVQKLSKDKEALIIVIDYELSSELEPKNLYGAIYCSPEQAKSFADQADEVVFHRYAFVIPKLK